MQKAIASVFDAEVNEQEQEKSDDELALEARHSSVAFAGLYRRYATGVYRYLYGRVGNQKDAEDLTSQTFLQALEAISRYRPKGHFAAWLFSIARRRAADFHRQGYRRSEFSLDTLNLRVAINEQQIDNAIQAEELFKLGQLYNQLPDDKQELIRLRYAAGLTYAQIGQVLKRSEAAVGMALRRIKDQLRQQLDEQESYDE